MDVKDLRPVIGLPSGPKAGSRLQGEAERERLVPRQDGLRHQLGHALMALGRAIHGIEAERPVRRSLDAC